MRYTRDQFINGLRDLATFLEERPEVPTPIYDEGIQVSAEHEISADHGAELYERVEYAARAMGVTPKFTDQGQTHYEARVSFGPLSLFVLAITPEHMRAYEEQQRLGREAYERLHAEAAVDEQERQGREIDEAAEATGHLPGSVSEETCCAESERLGDACAECKLGFYLGDRVSVHAPDRLAGRPPGVVESIGDPEASCPIVVRLDRGTVLHCAPDQLIRHWATAPEGVSR